MLQPILSGYDDQGSSFTITAYASMYRSRKSKRGAKDMNGSGLGLSSKSIYE